MRIGHGYDVHRFSSDRKLIVGGVHIDYRLGLLGHSDADVLVHSVIDSILGAAGLGDIGKLFPDTDEKYKNADSIELLKAAYNQVQKTGYCIGNIDSTIVAQEPKLSLYTAQMRKNISNACKTDEWRVNVKATTEEHMGFTGRLEGISCHSVCIIKKVSY